MAFVGLGVTGGIGAYKAIEVVRLLQKRGHDVQAVMTRTARRFVGPLTFEAITRHPVITSQFAPGAERRHRAHRARVEHGSAAGRAGDREHPRQIRERHRRRFSVGAVSRDARAGARRAGDEHPHVGASGRQAERRRARRARRALRRSRRRLSGLRLDRQGPPRRARRDCLGPARSRCAGARRCAAGACWSPPARRSRTSIPCAFSAIDRAAGWALRSRSKRTRAAPTSMLIAGPDDGRRRRTWARSFVCAARARCTRP